MQIHVFFENMELGGGINLNLGVLFATNTYTQIEMYVCIKDIFLCPL